MPNSHMITIWPLDIRHKESGALDEIVCSGGFIHLEQMSDRHWWLSIIKGNKRVHVNLASAEPIIAEVVDG